MTEPFFGSHVIRDRHGIETRVVALTFDDGPSPWTAQILDRLQANSGHATFFVVGNALAGREDLVRRIVAEGHELGVHTFTHRRLIDLSVKEIREELAATRNAIAQITEAPVRFWRPPGFRYTPRVAIAACTVGFRELVVCSIDPRDWSVDATEEGITATVLSEIQPGSIVDLHDGRPADDLPESAPTREVTVGAVGRLLPELLARGYRSVTLSQLLGAADLTPVLGSLLKAGCAHVRNAIRGRAG